MLLASISILFLDGFKIPFIYTPPSLHFFTNRSTIQYSDFVEHAISDLLATGSMIECESAPTVVNPLSDSIQSDGKKIYLFCYGIQGKIRGR